jgi:tetratricopeptide (TPR) repeat protein
MLRFVLIQPVVCSATRTEYRILRSRNEDRPVRLRRAAVWALMFVSALLTGALSAQDAATTRLMDQPPFDMLTLDKANDSKVYKVRPVRLPNRRVPEKPRPTDSIRVKMMENDEEYDVAWANIAKLDLYEQLVLAEVNKLAGEGRLDDAYDELSFLLTFYPNTPGLAEARQNYLYLSSAAAFGQQKYDESLAVLEELIAHNPNYRRSENSPPLVQRLGDIADYLISENVTKQEFGAARALLARLAKQYKVGGEPFVKKWREQLEQMAARSRDEAKAHLEAGRYVEAHDACSQMLAIWPDLAGAGEVAAEISRRHPLVRVGVEHPALRFDRTSLHDVAARRAGRLSHRLLVECTALGAEGGRFESPIAALSRSDDGMSLSFRLNSAASDTSAGYDLGQRLVARASAGSAEYDATWSKVVADVAVRGPNEVQIDLRTRHVLPEALLTVPLFGAAETQAAKGGQPFEVLSRDAAATRFAASSEYLFRRAGQPAEIVERLITDPLRAINALRRGEIDMLARVFPGDIAGLRNDESLVVAPYAGPTTHVVAVRSHHPFLSSGTFRRALLYGANREVLLSQGLLRGASLAGFRVVSGPFPAPVTGMELPTYGYDERIEPRPCDPRLGMALVSLAQGELKAAFEKQQKKAPELTPLVLGHPADETSRIACRGLVKDWKRIGVECKLVEFKPGVFDDADHQCDLVYLQLAVWEPVVDARRLFEAQGLAPSANRAIQLALRDIDQARNWQQVRERLVVLHRLVHEDATILPLWQTIDHFAYRRTLQGITPRRLELYQDVEQWRATTALARSQP